MFVMVPDIGSVVFDFSQLWPADMSDEPSFVAQRSPDFGFPISQESVLRALLLSYQQKNWPQLNTQQSLSAELKEAIASEWSRSFSFRLLIPSLTLWICYNQVMPLPWSDIRIAINSDRMTTDFFCIDDDPTSRLSDAASGAEALESLLDQSLWPAIAMLCQVTGASSRVLWGNAASYWGWWVFSEDLIQRCQTDEAMLRLQLAQSFITNAAFPDSFPEYFVGQTNRRNPLYQPMRQRLIQGETKKIRRVCCQRYHLPDTGFCSYCPHDVTGRKFASD